MRRSQGKFVLSNHSFLSVFLTRGQRCLCHSDWPHRELPQADILKVYTNKRKLRLQYKEISPFHCCRLNPFFMNSLQMFGPVFNLFLSKRNQELHLLVEPSPSFRNVSSFAKLKYLFYPATPGLKIITLRLTNQKDCRKGPKKRET